MCHHVSRSPGVLGLNSGSNLHAALISLSNPAKALFGSAVFIYGHLFFMARIK
jgi:hypothetical protein